MRFPKILALTLVLVLGLTACAAPTDHPAPQFTPPEDVMEIILSDEGVTANGTAVGTDPQNGVSVGKDIVYYEAGKDFTYGEGSEQDAHAAAEAAAHTVVHISKPGTYRLEGKLSLGQIAVDLGKDAKADPEAVVNLILNGVDITCTVAPAIIFYNVYECGDDDADKASKDVDTSAAGANVVIADNTVNTVNGSYVARIYKPGSVVLNGDNTQVEDADKLHKYDAAFYSKMSMNVYGGRKNTGVLNINAQNEGLDSELHLTVNGGIINIRSGNDGVNTNEDGVSVTTVNGGTLTIRVTGETGEGDGIDSNGWLVINGGTVVAEACSDSADAGIDSDMGIHINGGTVIATGHMLDRIEEGGQNYAVFNFAGKQTGDTVRLKDKNGNAVLEVCPENAYSILIYSSPDLDAGTYTLWSGDKQLEGQGGSMQGGPGMMPGGMTPPAQPDQGQPPEGQPPTPPDGNRPDQGDGFQPPQGEAPPQMPDGRPERPEFDDNGSPQEPSLEFKINDGANMFGSIR